MSLAPLVAACTQTVPPVPFRPTVPTALRVPTPTMENPLDGLPALSGDRKTIALPTYFTDEYGQERSITFIGVGDTESEGVTVHMPTMPQQPFVDQLTKRLRDANYTTMPWVLTPDEPQFPIALTVKSTELIVSGDPRVQLAVAVKANGETVGSDLYQVEGETQTSPERVMAIGATVLWEGDRGLAYVRHDIADPAGRESDWRVIALEKKAVVAPATTTPAPPPAPAPAPAPAAPAPAMSPAK